MSYAQIPPGRVHAYLIHRARQNDKAVSLPPFLLFEPDAAPPYTMPASAVLTQPLEQIDWLAGECERRDQQAQLHFLGPSMPDLAGLLAAQGYRRTVPPLLMYCTPDTLIPAPPIEGLRVAISDSGAPLEEIRDGLIVNDRGFDPASTKAFSDDEAAQFRADLTDSRAFTAYLHDRPVGAGMYLQPFDLITELVGIATLAEFRGRGIGRVLTAAMTQAAFERGIRAVTLGAVDDRALRVYRRVGFQPLPIEAFWLNRRS